VEKVGGLNSDVGSESWDMVLQYDWIALEEEVIPMLSRS